MMDECIKELIKTGIELTLEGFSDTATLPKSSEKLNGTHKITLNFLGLGDLKARLLYFGSISACLFYSSPDVKFLQEEQFKEI